MEAQWETEEATDEWAEQDEYTWDDKWDDMQSWQDDGCEHKTFGRSLYELAAGLLTRTNPWGARHSDTHPHAKLQ
eukprot:179416-Amphidinium_carterae.1